MSSGSEGSTLSPPIPQSNPPILDPTKLSPTLPNRYRSGSRTWGQANEELRIDTVGLGLDGAPSGMDLAGADDHHQQQLSPTQLRAEVSRPIPARVTRPAYTRHRSCSGSTTVRGTGWRGHGRARTLWTGERTSAATQPRTTLSTIKLLSPPHTNTLSSARSTNFEADRTLAPPRSKRFSPFVGGQSRKSTKLTQISHQLNLPLPQPHARLCQSELQQHQLPPPHYKSTTLPTRAMAQSHPPLPPPPKPEPSSAAGRRSITPSPPTIPSPAPLSRPPTMGPTCLRSRTGSPPRTLRRTCSGSRRVFTPSWLRKSSRHSSRSRLSRRAWRGGRA